METWLATAFAIERGIAIGGTRGLPAAYRSRKRLSSVSFPPRQLPVITPAEARSSSVNSKPESATASR
ncbi:hypothetical protein OFM36_35955, partial [Escherichia coli]|nr:hypothetical protein [Escherichia coli]